MLGNIPREGRASSPAENHELNNLGLNHPQIQQDGIQQPLNQQP